MKTIATTLTVVNETDVRGNALRDLIQLYLTGFNCYYGFRNPGTATEKVSFPALFVDPIGQDAKMVSTGKYEIRIRYDIIFYVVDNNAGDVVSLATSGMEALVKLFSNNALGDLTGASTKKFKLYSPYWINSEMSNMRLSKNLVWTGPDKQSESFYRVGWMQFEILDQLLK